MLVGLHIFIPIQREGEGVGKCIKWTTDELQGETEKYTLNFL